MVRSSSNARPKRGFSGNLLNTKLNKTNLVSPAFSASYRPLNMLEIRSVISPGIFMNAAVTKTTNMLIIKGLYSIKCKESKLKVFIELSYEEAMKQNVYEENEKTDDFRLQVIQKEQEIVQQLKKEADFFIDFDSSNEIFHL